MIKTILKAILPASRYNDLWRLWDSARRLFIYPQKTLGAAADYDAYWAHKTEQSMGQLSRYRRARAQVFEKIIAPDATVLDLGCGDGAILHHLVEQRSIKAYGIDLSPKAVAFARGLGLEVVEGDITAPLPGTLDREYDYIILSEVIEHLPDPEGLLLRLRESARVALLVSIPNTGWWHHRLRLALGRFPLQWVVFPGEHLRFWTLADFRWWTQAQGFDLAQMHPYTGIPGLRRLWPSLFAQGIIYVLKNKEE